MRAVLALDLATVTGWAAVRPDGAVVYGTERLAPPKTEVGEFLARAGRWITETIIKTEPDVIVFETVWVGPNTHQTTARKLMSLAGLTEMIAFKRDLECWEANTMTVVKHFTGDGGGKRPEKKARVMAECRRRGFNPETEDEADALAVLSYARHCLDSQ